MLYIIGLGLNVKGISLEGLEALKKCDAIYLENYTVDFPYTKKELEKITGKKIEDADRAFTESNEIAGMAAGEDIALLVYGSPLTATTHISLIEEAKKKGVKCRIIYSGSVIDAVAETGLQLYKFGKIASMPKWQKNFTPDSFMEIVKQNQKINSHSLILVDIGLEIKDAVDELKISAKKHRLKLDKILVCERLGTEKSRIYYSEAEKLKEKEIKSPYCMIIPSKLHFLEEDFLKNFEQPEIKIEKQ